MCRHPECGFSENWNNYCIRCANNNPPLNPWAGVNQLAPNPMIHPPCPGPFGGPCPFGGLVWVIPPHCPRESSVDIVDISPFQETLANILSQKVNGAASKEEILNILRSRQRIDPDTSQQRSEQLEKEEEEYYRNYGEIYLQVSTTSDGNVVEKAITPRSPKNISKKLKHKAEKSSKSVSKPSFSSPSVSNRKLRSSAKSSSPASASSSSSSPSSTRSASSSSSSSSSSPSSSPSSSKTAEAHLSYGNINTNLVIVLASWGLHQLGHSIIKEYQLNRNSRNLQYSVGHKALGKSSLAFDANEFIDLIKDIGIYDVQFFNDGEFNRLQQKQIVSYLKTIDDDVFLSQPDLQSFQLAVLDTIIVIIKNHKTELEGLIDPNYKPTVDIGGRVQPSDYFKNYITSLTAKFTTRNIYKFDQLVLVVAGQSNGVPHIEELSKLVAAGDKGVVDITREMVSIIDTLRDADIGTASFGTKYTKSNVFLFYRGEGENFEFKIMVIVCHMSADKYPGNIYQLMGLNAVWGIIFPAILCITLGLPYHSKKILEEAESVKTNIQLGTHSTLVYIFF